MTYIETAAIRIFRRLSIPALALVAILCIFPAVSEAAISRTLPDTPAGRLGGELIRHVDGDTPEQIRAWASTLLSAAIDEGARADFTKSLVAAARESGGIDLVDGTPVFDIKPYLPYAESLPDARGGFAPDEPRRLTVTAATPAFDVLPERSRRVITEALSLDPRPPAGRLPSRRAAP